MARGLCPQRSVADLLAELDATVKNYPPGVVKITDPIVLGTQFFPGACGVWREPGDTRPPNEVMLPTNGVVFFGHNYDGTEAKESDQDESVAQTQLLPVVEDLSDDPTGRGLLKLLDDKAIDLCRSSCFFTNVLMGKRKGKSVGRVSGDDTYYQECEAFLKTQVEWTQPYLVVVLGPHTIRRFRAVSPALSKAWHKSDILETIFERRANIVEAAIGKHRCTVVIMPHASAGSSGRRGQQRNAYTERKELMIAALKASGQSARVCEAESEMNGQVG